MTKEIFYASTAHSRNELRVHLKQINSLVAAGYSVNFLVCDGLGDETHKNLKIVDFGRPSSRWNRFLVKPFRIFSYARQNKAWSLHFHDPEFLLANIAMAGGIRTIYDCHEDVAGSIMHRSWIPGALRTLLASAYNFVQALSVKRLYAVISATDSIGAKFNCKRSLVIKNYPFVSEFQMDRESRNSDTWSACYVGTIALERGVVSMIKACHASGVKLYLAGWFANAETEQAVKALPEWSSVEFFEKVDRDKIREIYQMADFGMVLFHPLPNHVASQPNKLFEYLSADLPVVCSNFPLWKQVVEGNMLGVTCDPSDIHGIQSSIKSLQISYEQYRGRGSTYVRRNASWESEKDKLLDFYKELVK